MQPRSTMCSLTTLDSSPESISLTTRRPAGNAFTNLSTCSSMLFWIPVSMYRNVKKTAGMQTYTLTCHFLGFIVPSIQQARIPDTEESRGVRYDKGFG